MLRLKQVMILPVKALGIKVLAQFTEGEARAVMARMADWDDDETEAGALQERLDAIEDVVLGAVREVRGLEDEEGNAITTLDRETLRAMPAGSAKRILRVLLGAEEDDGSGRVVPLESG